MRTSLQPLKFPILCFNEHTPSGVNFKFQMTNSNLVLVIWDLVFARSAWLVVSGRLTPKAHKLLVSHRLLRSLRQTRTADLYIISVAL